MPRSRSRSKSKSKRKTSRSTSRSKRKTSYGGKMHRSRSKSVSRSPKRSPRRLRGGEKEKKKRKPSKFALFMKKTYPKIQQEHPDWKFSQVVKKVAELYRKEKGLMSQKPDEFRKKK